MSSFKNLNEEIEYLSKMISATREDKGQLRAIGTRLIELSGTTETITKGNVAQDRINQFDKVIRNICTELDITYAGVDIDDGEIIEAIKQLQASYGCGD
jgi:hypothetical protein